MLNPDDKIAQQLLDTVNDDLSTTFPNARLKHQPAAKSATLTQDIEALKARLDAISAGIAMLKAQL
jgi:hypothetical protein